MSVSKNSELKVEKAVTLLKKYSCNSVATMDNSQERELLRQSILLVTSLSEWENIGICADNEKYGLEALKSYLQGLGYQATMESYNFQDIRNSANISAEKKAVYIKFNTQKLSYYLDTYIGEHRGVLIAIQTENKEIVGTYGYFPLDLFTE